MEKFGLNHLTPVSPLNIADVNILGMDYAKHALSSETSISLFTEKQSH